jgi:S-DNA-T family DNA segregation ATPase FtsK/SpoIIIE
VAERSFNRPPRVRPRWSAEIVELPAPPVAPRREQLQWLTLLTPLIGAGIFALAALWSGQSRPWLMAVPMGALALLGLLAALQQADAQARQARREQRARVEHYEDRLEAARTRLRTLYEQEQAARNELSPDPEELLAIAGARGMGLPPLPRLWERRPGDDDFLDLRLGCGRLRAASQARLPELAEGAPIDRRQERLVAEYATLNRTPICLPLRRLGSLAVAGPRAAALPPLTALLWQAVVLHAPSDVRIATICEPVHSADWSWMRWLPHSVPLSNDPAHSRRMFADEPAAIERLLSEALEQLGQRRERRERDTGGSAAAGPHLLLVIDGERIAQAHSAVAELLRYGPEIGIGVIVLVASWAQAPEGCAAVVEVDERGARWTQAGEPWPRERFMPDGVTPAQSDRLARQLAGIKLLEGGGSQAVPRQVRLFDLLGIATAEDCAAPARWAQLPAGAWHPDVPFGAGADGKPVYLDLNENRHGPHGIIAGATGAGKSVLLQSIIAACVAVHPPERLQLFLIDFKGGAAFALFEQLPHLGGMVTDLEGRLAERALTAMNSELRRRKRLLKTTAEAYATKVENIADYRSLEAEHQLAPLPNLLIVVDEFDELARTYPEFVHELVRVVKQGRSLGVHLLLATQQPARAVTDAIRNQLTFFIALRLGGSDDSREMLLKPDAAFLPTDLPGRAYMRVGADVRLVQVAQVTGEYRPPAATGPQVRFVRGAEEHVVALEHAPAATGPRCTDLDLLIAGLRAAGAARLAARGAPAAPPIWQPPLPARLTLAEVLERNSAQCAVRSSEASLLKHQPSALSPQPSIGLLDLPQEGRQEGYAVDLAAGHLAVIGAPGSGKTMLLRTLLLSLALAHRPEELWCYIVDAGGQGLAPLAGLPHVGALIQARERERVRRLVRMLDGTIRARQDTLRTADAGDRVAYCAATGRAMPAIVVVIDKLAVLREEVRDGGDDTAILEDLARIARVGRPYGVHLVLSADRAADLGYKLLALLEQRIVLRLPDLHDYSDLLGTRVNSQLPPTPGRALIGLPDYGACELQVALPALEPPDADGAPAALRDAELLADLRERVANLAATLPAGGAPPPIELLPERVVLAALPTPAIAAGVLEAPIGLADATLGVARVRLDAVTPHLLIVGGRRSGKTTALQTIVRGLAAHLDAEDWRLAVLDGPRGGLRSMEALPHLALYADDEAGAAELAALIGAWPAHRPTGGRLLVVIDDYVLCRERMREQLTQSYGTEPNLLQRLNDCAQAGAQHGVHLLLAANISYADDALLRALDGGRSGLALWPGRYDGGTRLLGVDLPLADQRNADQPPGRAVLVQEDDGSIVQIAIC